jgi:hypothetical protein
LGHRQHGYRRRGLSDDLKRKIDFPPLTGHKKNRETKVSRILLAVLVRGLAEHVVYVVAFGEASRRAAKIGLAAARLAFRLIHARTFCQALRRLMDVGSVSSRRYARSTARPCTR